MAIDMIFNPTFERSLRNRQKRKQKTNFSSSVSVRNALKISEKIPSFRDKSQNPDVENHEKPHCSGVKNPKIWVNFWIWQLC